MQEIPVNYLAVLVAAAAKFGLGALWYSPLLFGPAWMRAAGVGPEQMKASLGKGMVVDAVGSVIMAFVLVHAVVYAGAQGVLQGAAVGFLNWLAFIGVTTLSGAIYERRPLALWLINNAYLLLALLIMGAIVAVWR